MRTAFFEALVRAADADPSIFLVVGDLGFKAVDPFVARFPDRFLNVGVAEQNLAGIAAGLALSGKTVFTYSIANFPTLRCFEQVRNDICGHRANVKLVAIGGGLAYGPLGMSHHATEDLAVMRALPEMVVVAPADPVETTAATLAITRHRGPCYLRLGRVGEPVLHTAGVEFHLGRAIQVRPGDDLTLISTGAMLETALQVANQLSREGFQARVLSMHTVKPLDADAVLKVARETGAVFTLEEHSIIGGLGGAVAEMLAESSLASVAFKRFGLSSSFAATAGSQEFLRAQHGLSARAIAEAIERILATTRLASPKP